jgi:polysaccharide deacetylase 2 family uncharacterized protein YibQ
MLIAAPRAAGLAVMRLVPARLAFARLVPALNWRSPRAPMGVGAVLLGVIGLVALAAGLFGIQAPLRYDGVPQVLGSVPQQAVPAAQRVALFGLDSPAVPPPPLAGAWPDPAAPSLDVDPALLEWRDGIALPRIAADGRRPLDLYARTVPADAAGRPRIAVLIVDLGLDAERLEQSVQLPGTTSFAHTPYAAHLPAWQRHARWHGHEVLLDLPLQPRDFPASDLGPWALDPLAPTEVRLLGLERVLARSDGYVGLAAASEGFTDMPDRFAPLAEVLAGRGLGFVELGDDRLAAVAARAGLAYATAVGPLDAVPDPDAIDAALGQLEGQALREGVALGYLQPYPLSFDRLWQWGRTLDAKGITLVPVSGLLRGP